MGRLLHHPRVRRKFHKPRRAIRVGTHGFGRGVNSRASRRVDCHRDLARRVRHRPGGAIAPGYARRLPGKAWVIRLRLGGGCFDSGTAERRVRPPHSGSTITVSGARRQGSRVFNSVMLSEVEESKLVPSNLVLGPKPGLASTILDSSPSSGRHTFFTQGDMSSLSKG